MLIQNTDSFNIYSLNNCNFLSISHALKDLYAKVVLIDLNVSKLVCPFCSNQAFIRWGYSNRNVLYFDEDLHFSFNISLNVQRIKCKNCGRTHIILLDLFVPTLRYSQYLVSNLFAQRPDVIESLYAFVDDPKKIIKNTLLKLHEFALKYKKVFIPSYTHIDCILDFGFFLYHIDKGKEFSP